MNNDVLVSICTLTFNHAPYLNKYFEGILMQKTNFKYEVIINDDCSTDGTKEILLEYASKYPELIKVVIQEENQYSKGDRGFFAKYCYPRCKGKYVAWCEGDDCWIDPYKLQKQVDYLESHPECVLVHTDHNRVNVSSGYRIDFAWKLQRNFNQINRDFGTRLLWLIMQGKYSVITLTACARMDAIRQSYSENKDLYSANLQMGDTPVWLMLSQKGSFHYIPDVTAEYHILQESATHSNDLTKIISFYASCVDMVNLFAEKYNVPEKVWDASLQKYFFFILRSAYLSSGKYMNLILETVVRGRKIALTNSILVKTCSWPMFTKRIIAKSLTIIKKLKGRIDYCMASLLGII